MHRVEILQALWMAICRICGKVEPSLPVSWTNWECELCFLETLVSQIKPDGKVCQSALKFIAKRRDAMNEIIADSQMELALQDA